MDDAERKAREARAEERRRTWKGGLAKSFSELDQIDLEWWMGATPAQRVRGVTQLMDEMRWMGGDSGPSPRLQRSVGGARRRGS